mmetsp:Transcript_16212/g.46958  ORF Transcript_16212/g.46958 Transcript_16212/m.46958 type:complete len:341 (-) Transcript_16212:142-1164(-)
MASGSSLGAVAHQPASGSAMAGGGGAVVGTASSVGSPGAFPRESPLDMDVTVLAFAQWVSELKTRQSYSQNQVRAEMSTIRTAVSSNQTDLADFRRHGAAIQQQMQSEINDIRNQLSGVFSEITTAVRNNSAADQDIKLKIQSLNEQAVRNETAFAQLADAADQSQSRLRSAVTEMQLSSERLRDELASLTRQTEGLETTSGEKAERICSDIDQLSQDIHMQLERRREHLRKMVNDVVAVGESLQSLAAEFGELRKGSGDSQSKIQSTLASIDLQMRKEGQAAVVSRPLAATVDIASAPGALPPHAVAGSPVHYAGVQAGGCPMNCVYGQMRPTMPAGFR